MTAIPLRSIVLCALLVLPAQWAAAQTAAPPAPLATPATPDAASTAPDAAMQISWEVRNRFRLFREERDFKLFTESAQAGSILASEDALELQSDGRGWARNIVNRLCIDLTGKVGEACTRDNVKENYLAPRIIPSRYGSPARSRSARPAPGRSTMAAAHRAHRRSTAPSR